MPRIWLIVGGVLITGAILGGLNKNAPTSPAGPDDSAGQDQTGNENSQPFPQNPNPSGPIPTKPDPAPALKTKVKSILNTTYLIRKAGGRLDWSDANNLVAYDKTDSENYAKIWTMDRNGGGQRCLTCGNSLLGERHHGNPDWHPSGEFLAIQILNPSIGGPLAGTDAYKLYTSPGAGVQNDVWVINKDASKAWKVTNVDRNGGVLHPHFSNDGKKLAWAERLDNADFIGSWVIKIADVSISNGSMSVRNITSLKPGNFRWYEVHDFSPDDSTIIFSGMRPGGKESDYDVYTYNLRTQALKELTDPSLQQWDEHAHILPNGEQVIWMSSMGINQAISAINTLTVKTDYWIMNIDGTDKRRLTFFNDPSSPSQIKPRAIASDLSLSKDGKTMFAYVQDPGRFAEPGSIIRFELKAE